MRKAAGKHMCAHVCVCVCVCVCVHVSVHSSMFFARAFVVIKAAEGLQWSCRDGGQTHTYTHTHIHMHIHTCTYTHTYIVQQLEPSALASVVCRPIVWQPRPEP